MLDALLPSWRGMLIAPSSDGESTMTGRHPGVVTRLEEAAINKILRVWCVTHQIDLVIKKTTSLVDRGDWSKAVYALLVWLRREEVLIIEMKKRCPKKTQRWVQLGKLLTFNITNLVKIMTHCERKHPPQAPTCAWWVRTLAIYLAMELVNCTIITIQRRSLLLAQQPAEVAGNSYLQTPV
ncbi:hypothetical protein PF006_g1994 [Phytophthora fragariae]|uniref:DUF659 domain-containing protein n=1 Tax=Phytophthora fragariae TaxID=53985 RepID=A0A6A3MBI5_9STRA|nr:hypothetical protein PF011_g1965 [Phytophthora fragariae]KAE9153933.1 hypothetical protein PF006_g1994 [Phytophthora fragariae]